MNIIKFQQRKMIKNKIGIGQFSKYMNNFLNSEFNSWKSRRRRQR